MTDGEPKNLGMPLEIAKKNLRDDPQTHAIAEALGVDVEDYIDKVIDYARHPDKEPELELLDEESIAQLGPDVPSVADVTHWFEQVAEGEIELDDRVEVAPSDGFSTGVDRADALRAQARGEAGPRRAPGVEEVQRGRARPAAPEAGSVLKQQLLEQQRQFQLGMDARRAGHGTKTPPKRS